MKRYLALAALAVVPLATAQELKLSLFDRLKPKASGVVDINVPKNLIDVASAFLGSSGGDNADLKKLTAGLTSIVVKSFEFDKEGVYTDADVKDLIAELGAPGWDLVVSADEKNEKSRIWIKSSGNGEVGGLRIMAAEPKELTVVSIGGKVRLEDLKNLGALGVPPNILSQHGQPNKKEEE